MALDRSSARQPGSPRVWEQNACVAARVPESPAPPRLLGHQAAHLETPNPERVPASAPPGPVSPGPMLGPCLRPLCEASGSLGPRVLLSAPCTQQVISPGP